MVDPIDYTAGLDRAISTGARLGGLMGIANQQELENQKAAEAQQLAKQFQTDWQSSFGDPQKMTALAAKYPSQMDAIKSGIGFQDEQHQQALGNAARDLRVAMATGNPQAVQQAATKHAGVLGSVGSSADDITQQFQQDPNSLANLVDAVGLSALGAKDYYGVQNDRAQRQNDVDKLQEQVRSNKATEAVQWANNNIAQQNTNLRKMELDDKRNDRVIQSEANSLKRDELIQKSSAQKDAIIQKKSDFVSNYNNQINSSNDVLQNSADLLRNPKFGSAFGVKGKYTRDVAGSDSAAVWSNIALLQASARQQGIAAMKSAGQTGSTSDADAKAAMDAFLSINENTPEKEARSIMNRYASLVRRNSNALQKIHGPTARRYDQDVQSYNSSFPSNGNQGMPSNVAQGVGIIPPQQAPQQPARPAAQQTTQPKTSGYQSLWGD